ncbi:hypothetical protein TNCV_3812561 [Trichonephila clavipes]|nr:hypothetical protein TNCV_3812561 [Trichonephila clavipes]
MSARHHLKDYDRGRAVGSLEAGQSVTTVVTAMGESKSVISRLKKVAGGVIALRNNAEDQGRSNTPLEGRYTALVEKRNINFSPGWIATNLETATGTHVSARTISRRIN